MQSILKILTKRNVLIVGLLGSLILLALIWIQESGFCYARNWCWHLWSYISHNEVLGIVLFFLPLVFLFSLITYFLPDRVFRTWLYFTLLWVPLSIILTFIADDSGGGGWGLPSISLQEVAIFLLPTLFAIISLVIILVSYVRNQNREQMVKK